jgi:hypothetical protein
VRRRSVYLEDMNKVAAPLRPTVPGRGAARQARSRGHMPVMRRPGCRPASASACPEPTRPPPAHPHRPTTRSRRACWTGCCTTRQLRPTIASRARCSASRRASRRIRRHEAAPVCRQCAGARSVHARSTRARLACADRAARRQAQLKSQVALATLNWGQKAIEVSARAEPHGLRPQHTRPGSLTPGEPSSPPRASTPSHGTARARRRWVRASSSSRRRRWCWRGR